jgi:hypothetical protein
MRIWFLALALDLCAFHATKKNFTRNVVPSREISRFLTTRSPVFLLDFVARGNERTIIDVGRGRKARRMVSSDSQTSPTDVDKLSNFSSCRFRNLCSVVIASATQQHMGGFQFFISFGISACNRSFRSYQFGGTITC